MTEPIRIPYSSRDQLVDALIERREEVERLNIRLQFQIDLNEDVRAENVQLMNQRDALLAAGEAALKWLDVPGVPNEDCNCGHCTSVLQLRAAIAPAIDTQAEKGE